MRTISRVARRATAVAGVTCGAAAMAALLAACGSHNNPSGASAGQTATKSASSAGAGTPAGVSHGPAAGSSGTSKTQCPASGLTAAVASSQGGAAAGSSYVPIDFTNISAHTCIMYGYPGVSWVTAIRGSQIGSAATRESGYRPVTVTLAPGASAHAVMQIADAGNFPTSACQPVTAHWLRIYPPDQYSSLYAKFTTQVCSKKISGGSFPLGIMPLRSGRGVRGQTP
jgi:Protein of unknown function (DUF4232)